MNLNKLKYHTRQIQKLIEAAEASPLDAHRAAVRRYKAKNKDKVAEYQRQYQQKNRAKRTEYMRKYREQFKAPLTPPPKPSKYRI